MHKPTYLNYLFFISCFFTSTLSFICIFNEYVLLLNITVKVCVITLISILILLCIYNSYKDNNIFIYYNYMIQVILHILVFILIVISARIQHKDKIVHDMYKHK